LLSTVLVPSSITTMYRTRSSMLSRGCHEGRSRKGARSAVG
jgi:hypothetical protein